MSWCVGLLAWLLVGFGLPTAVIASGTSEDPLWVERVPTALLVLMMGRLSDEPDSVVDRSKPPEVSVPYAQRSLEEQIAWQIKIRLYRPDRTGWLDHWLFMRRARREPASVLTDPTSMRGQVYLYVLRAWAEQERLSFEDERWARSVHHLRIEHPGFDLVNERVYAHIGVRRLVEGERWRVRVGRTLYDTKRSWESRGAAGYHELIPVGLPIHGWWDGNARLDDVFLRRSGHVFPKPTSSLVRISGAIYDGDPFVEIWWPAGRISETVEMKIATAQTEEGRRVSRVKSIDGVRVIDDPSRTMEWMERSIQPRFEFADRSRNQEEPPESVYLAIDDTARERPGIDPFTFGGIVRVVIEKRDGGRYGEDEKPGIVSVPVMEAEDTWWALRGERDDQGRHVFFGQWKRVPLRSLPVMQHGMDGRFVHGADNFAVNDEIVGGYLEIRFGLFGQTGGGTRATSDLEMEQLLTHPVRLRLSGGDLATIARLCRTDVYRAGRTDLYTDEELEALKIEHPRHTRIGPTRSGSPTRE